MLGAAVFFAAGLTEGQAKIGTVVLGGLHGMAHIALGWRPGLWRLLPFHDWPGRCRRAAAGALPAGRRLVARQLVSLYLLVAALFGVNVNELFAGQGIEDSKSFLRMRIAPDGTLTIYPIGVDRISREVAGPADGLLVPAGHPAAATPRRRADRPAPAARHAAEPAVLPTGAPPSPGAGVAS